MPRLFCAGVCLFTGKTFHRCLPLYRQIPRKTPERNAAIIITLCIIIGAVWTKRCLEFMIAGSIAAAIFVYHGGFLAGWGQSLQDMLSENVWVMLVCLLFGGLIGLLTDSRGSFGFSRYISKICNTQRKTLLTTFLMGILIFVDDYLNVLSIGACMKKISDRQKLPRETLALGCILLESLLSAGQRPFARCEKRDAGLYDGDTVFVLPDHHADYRLPVLHGMDAEARTDEKSLPARRKDRSGLLRAQP